MKIKAKIVVINCEATNLDGLQDKLEREGMEVEVVSDRKAALNRIAKQKPDLILLDNTIPGLNGIEICQRLKREENTQSIPIIFISAISTKEEKIAGFNAGAVDYITKPIDLEETTARIKAQLLIRDNHYKNLYRHARENNARQSAIIGTITESIAHNLNNSLSVIVGYIDHIETCANDPKIVKRNSELINKVVQRIVKKAHQLNLFANKNKVELTLIPIGQLLRKSINHFSMENNITSNIKLSNQNPETNINTNIETFGNILGLLLMNALESYPESYTKERKVHDQTKISQHNECQQLQIKISDRGKGIDPNLADYVFDPFITSKPSVNHGLGLTIARHSIRKLGGDITFERNSQGGTTVIFNHPL